MGLYPTLVSVIIKKGYIILQIVNLYIRGFISYPKAMSGSISARPLFWYYDNNALYDNNCPSDESTRDDKNHLL